MKMRRTAAAAFCLVLLIAASIPAASLAAPAEAAAGELRVTGPAGPVGHGRLVEIIVENELAAGITGELRTEGLEFVSASDRLCGASNVILMPQFGSPGCIYTYRVAADAGQKASFEINGVTYILGTEEPRSGTGGFWSADVITPSSADTARLAAAVQSARSSLEHVRRVYYYDMIPAAALERFSAAIASAKSVLDDARAPQQEVDAAQAALERAASGFEQEKERAALAYDMKLGPQPPAGSGYSLRYLDYKGQIYLTGFAGTLPGHLVLPEGNYVTLLGYHGGLFSDSYAGFRDQTSLRSVTIPEGVTTLQGNVFANCTNLSEITLPGSMESLLSDPFQGCTSLRTIRYGGTEEEFARVRFGDSPLPEDVEIICEKKVAFHVFPKSALKGGVITPDRTAEINGITASPAGGEWAVEPLPDRGISASSGGVTINAGLLPPGTYILTYTAPTGDAESVRLVQPAPSPSAQPSESAAPGQSVRPSSAPTATATPAQTPAPSPGVSAGPTAAPAPVIPAVPGYQGGRANGKTYYAKTSGTSMLFYQKKPPEGMTRVIAPTVRNKAGVQYCPVNCGGRVLFPRISKGVLTAYCEYRDGREIPVLAVQSLPAAPEGSTQTFSMNGRTYYVRLSGSSMLFYQRNPSGGMTRVIAPTARDKAGTEYGPVNCGGTVLVPQFRSRTFRGCAPAGAPGSDLVLTPAN